MQQVVVIQGTETYMTFTLYPSSPTLTPTLKFAYLGPLFFILSYLANICCPFNVYNSRVFALFYNCSNCSMNLDLFSPVTCGKSIRASCCCFCCWSIFEICTHWLDSCQTTPTLIAWLHPQWHPDKIKRPPSWFSGELNTLGLEAKHCPALLRQISIGLVWVEC